MIEVPIRVLNLDLEDEVAEDVLVRVLGDFLVTGEGDSTVLSIFTNPTNVAKEALKTVRTLKEELPQVTFLGVDRDLVGLSDIGLRVGLSREAIRKWSRLATFPLAQDTIGESGQRVWMWTEVVSWIREHKGINLEDQLPTVAQIQEIDYFLNAPTQNTTARVLEPWGSKITADYRLHQGQYVGHRGVQLATSQRPTDFVIAA